MKLRVMGRYDECAAILESQLFDGMVKKIIGFDYPEEDE